MMRSEVSCDGSARKRSRRNAVMLLLIVTGFVVSAHNARGADFNGYAETGWNYENKAYCCEDAVGAAQEDSARSCEAAGGYPDFRRSSARGRCDWQTTRGADGRRIYKCTATASVRCR